MTRVLILIILILIIAYLFNRWRQQREAEQQRLSAAQERQRAVAAQAAPSVPTATAGAASGRAEGLFQDAADTAMGTDLGESTARLQAMTAELGQARQEAEAASARLSAQADAALEELRLAASDDGLDEPIEIDAVLLEERGNAQNLVADVYAAPLGEGVPPGAVRGDGGRDCPPIYPVKGSRASMLFHEPGSPSYNQTIPEFCFSNAESAIAAGFGATPH